MSQETESFLRQLNEAARLCPNQTTKAGLRECAERLKAACVALADDVTIEKARLISSLFARGWRLLAIAKFTPPAGNGGRINHRKVA